MQKQKLSSLTDKKYILLPLTKKINFITIYSNILWIELKINGWSCISQYYKATWMPKQKKNSKQ